jgi:hypothetical protein
LSCFPAFMATEVSFRIFSIDSGSLAILFSSASISAVRVSAQPLIQLFWLSSAQVQVANW